MRRKEWKEFQHHYFPNTAQNTDWLFYTQVFTGCFVGVIVTKAAIDRILHEMEGHLLLWKLYWGIIDTYCLLLGIRLVWNLTSKRKHLFYLRLSRVLLITNEDDLQMLELEGPTKYIKPKLKLALREWHHLNITSKINRDFMFMTYNE